MYPLGNILASLILGENLHKFSRKSGLFVLNIFLVVSFILFTWADDFKEKTSFIVMGFVARLIQGIGVGGICVICYSYISILFSDYFNQVIAYFELAISLGISIGPVIGDGLFMVGSYQNLILSKYNFVLISFAGFLFFFQSLLLFLIPKTKQQNPNMVIYLN